MAAVSENFVREFFELHGFLVRQPRKFVAPARQETDDIDFFVINPKPLEPDHAKPNPFVLSPADLASIACAAVVVKGWHTDTFSPSLLSNTPEMFRALDPAVFHKAIRDLSVSPSAVRKLLVVPSLPHDPETRSQSLEILRAHGVDGVLPFHTVLASVIGETEVNRNYTQSDLLQTVRILKHYDFFREPQLELFKTKSPRNKPTRPRSPEPTAGPEAGDP